MKTRITMQTHVANYLAEQRRRGYGCGRIGPAINDFARYVEQLKHRGPLTVELMAQWAKNLCKKAEPAAWARRLKLLRPFMRYLRQFEPLTEVPEESVFGPVPDRLTPHIYHEQEIVDLLAAARRLGPPGNLRAATHETLFGLIAAAGLRISEAMDLLDLDVDLKQGMLTIRQTKFAKSRQLPLHPTAIAALQCYRRLRNRHIVVTPEMPFFVGSHGKYRGQRLRIQNVDLIFAGLRKQLGWGNRGAHHAPRIHDLRHTFAVRRVMLWHEHGTDIDQAMLALSTYMGHAKISNTYWYLTAVPELMAVAAGTFERFAHVAAVPHA